MLESDAGLSEVFVMLEMNDFRIGSVFYILILLVELHLIVPVDQIHSIVVPLFIMST